MKNIVKDNSLQSTECQIDKNLSNFSTLTTLSTQEQETTEGGGFFYDLGKALTAKFCACNPSANDGFHDDMSGWTR
jgi:hypothetical protein